MTMTDDSAETALQHARQGRRVLIVVRRAAEATDVIDRVSRALTDDDAPAVVRSAPGSWYVRSSAFAHAQGMPHHGEIVATVSTPHALRGRTADTVLIAPGVGAGAVRDAQAVLMASSAPVSWVWQ